MVRDLMAIEERQIQYSSTHETHDLEKALERERQNIEREALSKSFQHNVTARDDPGNNIEL
ncbi:hypothetical protein L916_03542 [Phytophthora nicotianae]|uniref:Uncharacterized protein n=1 Tax=Phytophthora nicotianae TaxID=4792 RepID=W2JLI9_PHYNI|nr:hypothetical protein L916_03542 [Phytophthora nicotianae]